MRSGGSFVGEGLAWTEAKEVRVEGKREESERDCVKNRVGKLQSVRKARTETISELFLSLRLYLSRSHKVEVPNEL